MIAGLPFFIDAFNFLGGLDAKTNEGILSFEGRRVLKSENFVIRFECPFNIAINAERVSLNLLQRAISVASMTSDFVKKVEGTDIKILDTRKTTPGLRAIEKYAVALAGGSNHRFGQLDMFMIKDNHKKVFGNLTKAFHFFKNLSAVYQPILAEIHSLTELEEAKVLGIKHVMLDNFSSSDIIAAIKIKPSDMTFEVSGGVNLKNIKDFCIEGIDYISIGSLTSDCPRKDISLKMRPL